jgi:hypothetical protein
VRESAAMVQESMHKKLFLRSNLRELELAKTPFYGQYGEYQSSGIVATHQEYLSRSKIYVCAGITGVQTWRRSALTNNSGKEILLAVHMRYEYIGYIRAVACIEIRVSFLSLIGTEYNKRVDISGAL